MSDEKTVAWPTITCRVCEKPASFDCRMHFVADIHRLRAENARLLEALHKYRYEDCPECFARREMLADVTPLSPGSKNVFVKPTGWKMEHFKDCEIGELMAMLETKT